ncbi:hypothetical protein Tco_0422493 [Tanacetum coccineum]
MANLKFADTHNMVAFLSKPEESDGFEQIVDFLNAHPIKYALTVNPTIYISCIEQFWSTVKAKTINGEVQLHALVDGKKIIITESTVRRDLQLEDAEGVDCLPNSTIFEQLTLMGSKTTAWNEFSSTMASAIICLATNQKFNFSKYIFESMIRNLDNLSSKFLMYPSDNVADEAVLKELGDSLVRTATTAYSLEAKQNNGNITKTRSKATPNESSSLGTTLGGGPRCQETIGDTIAQTRFENVSKHSNDSLLTRDNTLRSDEDRLKLDELMALCTTLQNRVLDLEKTKTTQANVIASLKRRVKKLENKNSSRTHKLKRLYKVGLTARVESSGDEESLDEDASKQGRINAIDADEEITLVSVQDDADKEMFNVDALNGEEVFVAWQTKNVVEEVVDAAQVSTAAIIVTITTEEITLAQALEALKTSKLKMKGIVFQELGKSITTTTISSQQSQDKGKGILIEPMEPMKKKDLIRLDEEAKIDADRQLAERLQAQEQEGLSIEEKATLFQQLLEKRRKHFAAKKAKEKRNKPPSKAQQRKIMCTYLKNMEGYKLNDLKLKRFDSIQEMFDRAFKRVNTFEDFRTELTEGKEKRVGTELAQEITKKQKVENDKEITEIKKLMEIILDEEEVAIDAIPLAVKSPSIIDWKIHKEGRKRYYQIIRADRKSQMYMIFSHMLKSFDREDLETLYKLVKAKYKSTRLVEDLDLVFWNDLKTMFELHVEDNHPPGVDEALNEETTVGIKSLLDVV